jgi:hypothetical protein
MGTNILVVSNFFDGGIIKGTDVRREFVDLEVLLNTGVQITVSQITAL